MGVEGDGASVAEGHEVAEVAGMYRLDDNDWMLSGGKTLWETLELGKVKEGEVRCVSTFVPRLACFCVFDALKE